MKPPRASPPASSARYFVHVIAGGGAPASGGLGRSGSTKSVGALPASIRTLNAWAAPTSAWVYGTIRTVVLRPPAGDAAVSFAAAALTRSPERVFPTATAVRAGGAPPRSRDA